MGQIQGKDKEVVIVGDVNAKSSLWGSPHLDERGQLWAATLDLAIKTEKGEPTFVRRDSKSHIAITVATSYSKRDKAVLPDENLTDHRYIRYEIVASKAVAARREPTKVLSNWEVFRTDLQRGVEGLSANEKTCYTKCTEVIKRAYRNAIRVHSRVNISPLVVGKTATQRVCIERRRSISRLPRDLGAGDDTILEKCRKNYKTAKINPNALTGMKFAKTSKMTSGAANMELT
ncbi:hypothetical protein ILUMI_21383 [Ignelater luminosus]|uniref:Endonuclease/exonuclease/phosphatase domain-containing protein n=1 Tax=Ignelater luminosus TaxID=2038154 RepID=A0A8K0G3M1_IGNLU|nr:hypothetical protein ILUMI_21383 [Ignelater luminosus]